MGSENIVCINLGLATINDACGWVEYCNYPKGTYYSDLRAKYGHEKPYNVQFGISVTKLTARHGNWVIKTLTTTSRSHEKLLRQ